MPTILSLTPEEQDQLKELLNIGVSHAGTRLSQLVGRRVAISVPYAVVQNITSLTPFTEEGDDVSVAVLLRLSGGIEGYVLLYFPHHAAVHLLHAVSGKKVGDIRAFDAYDRSVFQEIGNVLAGGMLTGLAEFLHVEMLHSVPDVVIDMSSAMFNSLSTSMIASHEEFVSLDIAIEIGHTPLSIEISSEEEERSVGRMFLFLGPDAAGNILRMTREMVS